MKDFSYIILFFFFWILLSPLQTVNAQNYHIEKIPSGIGLANVSVNDILEDNEGFLWLATWSGLVKYDGYRTKRYEHNPNDPHSIKGSKITCLFEDSKNNLWIGSTYTGFYKYEREYDKFTQYIKDPENMNTLSNNNVWVIFEDSKGRIWVGTENGLNRFDVEQNKFIHYLNNPSDSRSLSNNFIYNIKETDDGSLWIGTKEGLNRLIEDSENGKDFFVRYDLSPKGLNKDDFLAHNFIYKIYPSRYAENKLWICTSIGLKEVEFSASNFTQYNFNFYGHNTNSDLSLSHRFVPDMWEENENKIWVATYDGLNLLDKKNSSVKIIPFEKSSTGVTSNNIIKTLAVDHSDYLWVGSEQGLNKVKLRPESFQTYLFDANQTTDKNLIASLALASNGKGIWAGLRGGGLQYFPIIKNGIDLKQSCNFDILPPKFTGLANFTSSMLVDQSNNLWIGTHGAGIIKSKEKNIKPKSKELKDIQQLTNRNGLYDNYVMSIFESKNGNIWIGYWDKGITCYNPNTNRFQHFQATHDLKINLESFPVIQFEETVENEKNILWIGTRGGGVYQLSYNDEDGSLIMVNHFLTEPKNKNSLNNNFITEFFVDTHERVWIGTENGINIYHPDDKTFTSFTTQDGLENGFIVSFIKEKKGEIWGCTTSDIFSIKYHQDSTQITNHYGVIPGFSFSTDAAQILSDEEIVLGGTGGFVKFSPDKIELDTFPPKVVLTDFKLFNKSVPIGENKDGRIILNKSISQAGYIELTHQDNVMSFDFVGIHLGNPSGVKYAYQLEGFDENWVYADIGQRTAYYTNLPYDDFTFRVKASNEDGVWSQPTELKLKVLPPFWLTKWAYLIYAALFFALLMGVRRITKIREGYKHRIELEHLEREKLEEVNQLKLRFFTNISHELRTPLTLIVSPLEQLIQERKGDTKMHQLFTRMHFNANRLLVMINQLLDIRKSEAGLLKLKVTENNLVSFTKEVVLSFKSFAAQRNIELTFSSKQENIPIYFDPNQLEKVFYNLLSNAFKFTPEGKNIFVHIEEKEEILISVKDEGQGIPAEQLPHIFDRFYQVEKKQEWRRKGGTGIGLSLLKNIVEAHHGKVEVESQVGIGSVFHIILKKGKAHFSETQLVSNQIHKPEVENYILPDENFENSHSNFAQRESDVQPKAAAAKKERPSILIVEDNLDIRTYLRENLESEFNIEEAQDGSIGLEKALDNPPDLILADIAMPKMDGIEMCDKIKSDINTSHVPVILLTARTSLVFKIDGLETGADDYVTKPFNLRLLKTRIKNLIESRQKLREKFAKNIDLTPSDVVIHSLDEQLLSQLKIVVERHIDDSDFSVEKLAHALNLSRMQLYRKLKALTGKSPNQVIRSIRMKRAVQLLKSKQYNVSEVTYMVGYNDLKSFREQFKKEFGMSPSEYHD